MSKLSTPEYSYIIMLELFPLKLTLISNKKLSPLEHSPISCGSCLPFSSFINMCRCPFEYFLSCASFLPFSCYFGPSLVQPPVDGCRRQLAMLAKTVQQMEENQRLHQQQIMQQQQQLQEQHALLTSRNIPSPGLSPQTTFAPPGTPNKK